MRKPKSICRVICAIRSQGSSSCPPQGAGGTVLLDERWLRRSVGLVGLGAERTPQPLLSELYYIERALDQHADLVRGGYPHPPGAGAVSDRFDRQRADQRGGPPQPLPIGSMRGACCFVLPAQGSPMPSSTIWCLYRSGAVIAFSTARSPGRDPCRLPASMRTARSAA